MSTQLIIRNYFHIKKPYKLFCAKKKFFEIIAKKWQILANCNCIRETIAKKVKIQCIEKKNNALIL